MLTIGVRELKQRASEIIRQVRIEGSEIQVTYRGRIVARLVPVGPVSHPDESQAWADLDRLAEEISTHWPAGISAAEAIADGRR